MGSGLSKHEDEIRADAAAAAREAARAKRRAESLASVSATANGEQSSGDSAQTESRCPMRRADGTYRFDFSAMFSGGFPHHPGGDHPISEKEAREKTKQPTASSQSTDRAAPSGGGCPVKHQEYNVYSQPIDPKNNMPRVANQLPAPGQTKELSTERVVSSIPKVNFIRCYQGVNHKDTAFLTLLLIFKIFDRVVRPRKDLSGLIRHHKCSTMLWPERASWRILTSKRLPTSLQCITI